MRYDYKEIVNNQDIKEAARRLEWDISSIIKERSVSTLYSTVIVAYILEKTAGKDIAYDDILDNFIEIDETIINEFGSLVTEDEWQKIVERASNYIKPVYACLALSADFQDRSFSEATPDSIIALSAEILDCTKKDMVADICCGGGSFIVNHIIQNKGAAIIGYEINYKMKIISEIRIDLLGDNTTIVLGNVFETIPESGRKFDKIFSNYPFGLRLRMLNTEVPYLSKLLTDNPAFSKATSSDWIFNSLICDSLSKKGKAVAIITNGSTWNNIDIPARKYFVENGLIESVIALPKSLFMFSNLATSLVVFSHNNKSIRLVDASDLCINGRRTNTISDENITEIIKALNNDSSISKVISLKELRDNDYSLHFGRYNNSKIVIKNGVKFESIIKKITRGAPCNAKELDEMASKVPTNMQYLMLANIKNGLIDDELPYLSTIEKKYEKYCLKNNNLILSKNGYPYKVAVVNKDGNKQILANGNLYIIELDENKANPFYIKAFLDSEDGIAALKSITVGATIPNIGVEDLKSLVIPLPTIAEQERVAKRYQAVRDEVLVLNKRLEQALNRLQHCFDDEKEG